MDNDNKYSYKQLLIAANFRIENLLKENKKLRQENEKLKQQSNGK